MLQEVLGWLQGVPGWLLSLKAEWVSALSALATAFFAAASWRASKRSAEVALGLKAIEEERRSREGVQLHFSRSFNRGGNAVGTLFSSGAAAVKVQKAYVMGVDGRKVLVRNQGLADFGAMRLRTLRNGDFFDLEVIENAGILEDPRAELHVHVIPEATYKFPLGGQSS